MAQKNSAMRFFAVAILLNMAASFAHPVTPTIIKNRNFGDYMFGVALAAAMTMNFLCSPFWGRLVSFLSSRKIMLVCCIGYAVGQAMFGLAATEREMVVARAFAGAFLSGAFTACLTYVVNTTPKHLRGNYLTIMATIGTVAGAFGFFVGGMLGEIRWSVAIIAQVIALSGCGVLLYLVCEDDVTVTSTISPMALVKEANPLSAFLLAKDIMTPALVAIFAVCALAGLGSTAFDQSFNYYLKAQLGLSSGYNGAIKALIGLVSLVANGTIGLWLINKTDMRRASIWIYLLCSISMLGVVLASATIPFVALNLTYFGLFAVSIPLTQSLVANEAKASDSNLVMGCYGGVKSLGSIFGALWAGLLYGSNPKAPFILGFAAFAIASVASVYYYQMSRRAGSRQASA